MWLFGCLRKGRKCQRMLATRRYAGVSPRLEWVCYAQQLNDSWTNRHNPILSEWLRPKSKLQLLGRIQYFSWRSQSVDLANRRRNIDESDVCILLEIPILHLLCSGVRLTTQGAGGLNYLEPCLSWIRKWTFSQQRDDILSRSWIYRANCKWDR